jgi:hypothetical protein
VDVKSLLSDLRLGIRAVVLLPLRRAFQPHGGIERFERAFFPERLFPTSLADRAQLRSASRCVACGLCDAASAELDPSLKPSLLPTVFSRSVVELPYAAADVRRLTARPELLRAAERLCPTGVPLEALARWLDQRGPGETLPGRAG